MECSPLPSCNWCGGQPVVDVDGCTIGWLCANGADPCSVSPCDANACPSGQRCGTDQLCWPEGEVVLTATYDGEVHGVWQNGTSQSIFLRGCTTVDYSELVDAEWIEMGGFAQCTWEGVAVEVPAGQTYEDPTAGTLGAGTYVLSGPYGVGCSPGVAMSEAGCTSSSNVESNVLVVTE